MAEKIDIDGVRFKVEADLSKLEGDLKKGEGAAKKGGENLGKAAGQGFAGTLKSNTSSALNSIEGQAGTMGSKVSGVFAKIGVAAAAAFAVDKVITFFKSAIDEAEKAEKASGKVGKGAADSFKKAEADIDQAIVNIKQVIGGPLLAVVRTVYDAVATILGGITKIVNAVADAFTTKDAEQITAAYHKQKKSLQELGSEMERLSSINNRTAEEELQLVKLKETLADRAQKLGINYAELTQKTKSYKEQLQEVERIERAQAKAEVGRLGASLQGGLGYLEQRRDELKSDMARAIARGDRRAVTELNKDILELGPRIERQKKTIDDTIKRFKNMDAPLQEEVKKAETAGGGGGGPSGQEARFLDSRQRLVTIEENRAYTIKKAYADKLSKEETERRIFMANEEARQATEYEIGSLRQGYAQFIEDTHMAKLEAIKSEADNARRLSYNLLEAELKQAGKNEEKIQAAKEANAERLGEIQQAQAEKQQELTLQSFARTMNAANATTTGLANIANAKNAGGAIGGIGGTMSGIAGFSDKFKGLGIIGSGISAIGGIVGALTSLFGKSEEDRKREIETARAIAERQHQEQMLVLEQQAQYQKAMLAIQEANSRTPFENLQRNLRLLDIKEQQVVLSGTPSDIARKQTLQSKLSAMQSILQSEGGKISADTLFPGTGTSPDELIQFLNTRKSQEAYVNSAVGAYNSAARLNFQSFGTPEGVAALDNYFRSALGNIESNRANLPDTLVNMLADRLRQALGLLDYGSTRTQGFGGYLSGQLRSALDPGLGDSLLSEVNRDTGIAENLLSVIEQSLQTQNEIKDATKRTAANTSRLVDTPNRSSSIIDISRGLTRSLGQVISGPDLTNTALPNGVRAAVLATDIQKSIQERSLDKLQNIETIQRDSRELLAIIAKGVNTNASGSLLAELESLYRRSLAA